MRATSMIVLTAVLVLAAGQVAGTAASPVQAGGGLPSVDEILERYYEALGGRDALERIHARVSTGRIVDDRPYTGPIRITRFEAYGLLSGQWALVEHRPDGDSAEGFNGAVGWKLQGGEVVMNDGAKRSKIAFICDPQGPLRIREYFHDLTVTDTAMISEQRVYVVETDRAKEYYTLYFGIEDALLAGIGYHWYIEGYEEVDGVLFPHRVIAGRKGGSVTYAFDEIVTNTPVSGGRFEPSGREIRPH